jgi:rhodanese-related sulfurtransferase
MTQPTSPLQAALSVAAQAQAELDRRVFHLKTIHDTACALAPLTQPHRIMEHFLLAAMGAVGLTRALALLVNLRTGQGWACHRGMTRDEIERVERHLPQVAAHHFPDSARTAAPELVSAPLAAACGWLPADTELLVRQVADEPYAAIAAFGAKLSGQAPDEADQTTLLNLTGVMLNALRQNLFHQKARHLHAGVARQTAELETVRQQAGLAYARLDRQVFNLRTIYEFTAESSPVLDSYDLLQRFLLTVMGARGVGAGRVLLCDRTARRVIQADRGLSPGRVWEYDRAEQHLYRCFQATEQRRLDPMSSSFVRHPQEVLSAGEAGFDISEALLFTVDEAVIGLLELGARLGPPGDPETERELLQGLTASGMVLLKNARAFETIQALNEDLRRANDDLRRTVAELTEAQRQIRILEVAKTRLRQAIQREVEQAGRFRPRDLLLLLILAAGLSLAFNASNPNGIPVLPSFAQHEQTPEMGVEAAHRLLAEGRAVLVDARPAELFQAGHIPRAINVPAPLFDVIYPMQLARVLQAEQTVLVYGRTVSRRYDEEVARRLLQRHDRVSRVEGGLDSWRARGYPVTP